ncbi:MAG TPA: cytochrome c oxidase assembly protein, partial [Microbacteriaceae bacterium]|nr:cytochrome c oxidase assembly protein [Microbacteriaceae bacterium]
PIADTTLERTSFFITIEFMLSFVELLIDSLPGVLLRINSHLLDNAPPLVGTFPSWFPNPLRDQQLAGDMLWFIAQFTDLPIIIVLFLRWMRTDRGEAEKVDELSDEEMEALMQEHLHGRREP